MILGGVELDPKSDAQYSHRAGPLPQQMISLRQTCLWAQEDSSLPHWPEMYMGLIPIKSDCETSHFTVHHTRHCFTTAPTPQLTGFWSPKNGLCQSSTMWQYLEGGGGGLNLKGN